jgi:hypothetical protein
MPCSGCWSSCTLPSDCMRGDVIIVYELSNIMKIVDDDFKIHQTSSACLTLKNALDESVS